MTTESLTIYRIAADALLAAHVLFVAFVLMGLVLIVAGGFRGWAWVRRPWFRYGHLAAIAIVVLQAWLGRACPLTVWEMALRQRAGDATYAGAFIAHWLERVLYYDLPAWVFTVCYSAFGMAVLAAWVLLPPQRATRDRAGGPR